MPTEESDEVLRYGANKNEPSIESVLKALSPDNLAISEIYKYKEEKEVTRLKISQDHKKEIEQLRNSHQLAMQKQIHTLNEAKFNSRLAAGVFISVFLIGIVINLYGPNKKLGETIATTTIGILSGIFIGKNGGGGGAPP